MSPPATVRFLSFTLALLSSPLLARGECSTSASCSFGSCSHGIACEGICSCSSSCGAAGVFCRCHCFSISLEPSFEADPQQLPYPRNSAGMSVQSADEINLASLAVLINDFGWGVEMDSGDEDHVVADGSWSGTLTEVVEDIAAESGVSVSWNDVSSVVTLTVD